ncbi:MAG: hypothetical protein MOGMAGMI_01717 [Candidatus Omnitrophica bacterium]|nr:hypothetical protein [Candidatus Omnitrophota bacterium]
MDRPLSLLLVEDNPADVKIVTRLVAQRPDEPVHLTCVTTIAEAVALVADKRFDAALLDLSLPDSSGLRTFLRLHEEAPLLPIIILTGLNDRQVALEAMRGGAHDYLSKDELDGRFLLRVIRYAIERQKMQSALSELSLVDELTGLYNRRGFLRLAERQLKLSARSGKGFVTIFADLDRMKAINDDWGHDEGDRALKAAGEILAASFRSTDILGRIGGDEFAVIAVEAAADSGPLLVAHLQERITEWNARSGAPYRIEISAGHAVYDPLQPRPFDEVLKEADRVLYEIKRSRRGPRPTV